MEDIQTEHEFHAKWDMKRKKTAKRKKREKAGPSVISWTQTMMDSGAE
jgi:hypothetical protein